MTDFVLLRDAHANLSDEFFLVMTDAGVEVGKIYREHPSMMSDKTESWFWCLTMPHYAGSDAPWYGNQPSKDAAKAAFRARWMLSHPDK
jgi:hypothetical protein